MGTLTIPGADNRAQGRRRTVVIRDPAVSPGQRLRDFITQTLDRLPVRLKKLLECLARPYVLLTLAALLVLLCAVMIFYYNRFAAEIDSRLQAGRLDSSSEITTAPLKLSVGNRFTLAELTDYLREAGYEERPPEADETRIGSFEVQGNSIQVFPGKAPIEASVSPVRIQLEQERVVSLTNAATGERTSSISLAGQLLASVKEGDRRKRIDVQFSSIPENLRYAILAAEDRRFFSHNGIDWHGIFRALKADINQGEAVQGGSTITQQLIKNAVLTPERTFSRKLKEAAMAVILESRLSKQQIFALYCSHVYLGQSGTFAINGLAEAAQVYFDKDLGELTLGESAFLAGLIHAPNRYSAHRSESRSVERRNFVLDGMVETGTITAEEAAAAKSEPLQIKKHEMLNDYSKSYFIDYVQRFVDERYGERGWSSRQRITTTLDPRLQCAAHGAVKRQTEKLDKIFARSTRKGEQHEPVQAALVAVDAHTGEVLAMIGGRSYDESQLNRATDAKRQPGSAFKPFVYATALGSRSYTAASVLSDTPKTFSYDDGRSEYKPVDYHGGFTNRNVTLREALARSLNVPTVELAMSVGLGNVADLAEKSGLERPRVYPSMALGASEVTPIELAGAYTAFANSGTALRPIPIRSVSGAHGSGQAERSLASSTLVFSPQVAYLMTNLLQSVVDSGTASRLRTMGLKGAIAGKTGTSGDGWFVGYTPNMVCVVWVGFDDNRDLRMKASDVALPIWADFMKQALELRPELGGESFARPGGIVTVDIDPNTGCLAGPESTSRMQEIFIAGTEPTNSCSQEIIADAELVSSTDEPPAAESPAAESLAAEPEEDAEHDDKITVEVCADTGLLASPACPHSEKKTFELGMEPLRACGPEFHRQDRR